MSTENVFNNQNAPYQRKQKHKPRTDDEVVENKVAVKPNSIYPDGIELSLMEEILLLGIKDSEGYTSIWNESLSITLRGCILTHLAMESKIELDGSLYRNICCSDRSILICDDSNTGDYLLDETLTIIKNSNEQVSLLDWLNYLMGESWNPFKLVYQLKKVRERVAKSLVDKGILCPKQQDFVVFSVTTFPVLKPAIKGFLIEHIKHIILHKWTEDLFLKDLRSYVLVSFAFVGDLADSIMLTLSNDEYEKASKVMSDVRDPNLATIIKNLSSLYASDNNFRQYTFKQTEFVLSLIYTLIHEF